MRFIDTAEQVRRELRHVSGAIRYEPEHRERGGGEEPRHSVPLWTGVGASGEQLAESAPDVSSTKDIELGREFVDSVTSPVAEAEISAAIAAVGDDEDRRIREQVAIDGIDALGWYATLHQDAWQWGVYLKAEGVRWLASRVLLPAAGDPALAVRLAVRAIHDHELMHFAEDWATAQLEVLFDRAFWWPIRESRNFSEIRISSERLANGYMLRRARSLPKRLKCRAAYAALCEWTLTQGDGYRAGIELVGTQRKFDEACRDHLSKACAGAEGLPWVGQAELHRLYPLAPQVDWRYCPVRVVGETPELVALISSLFIRQVPGVEETERFQAMLAGLRVADQRAWLKTRAQLAQTTQLKGLDFKPWTPRGQDWFSVRVSRRTRAHLRFESPTQRWFAEEIGEHKAMGHG